FKAKTGVRISLGACVKATFNEKWLFALKHESRRGMLFESPWGHEKVTSLSGFLILKRESRRGMLFESPLEHEKLLSNRSGFLL
ncbi:MAG: hypothetical protein JXI43_06385, partial [Tissierellales bacterium]|nr:hypothetical protein [Tissierellales bacterium]